MLETSWWRAALDKIDPKKFPKKPSLLWDSEADRQSAKTMMHLALLLADNGDEFRKSLPKHKLN